MGRFWLLSGLPGAKQVKTPPSPSIKRFRRSLAFLSGPPWSSGTHKKRFKKMVVRDLQAVLLLGFFKFYHRGVRQVYAHFAGTVHVRRAFMIYIRGF
jgi:hypothetical protein